MTRTDVEPRSRAAQLMVRFPVLSYLLIGIPIAFLLMTGPILAEYDVIPGKHAIEKIGLDLEEAASFLLVVALAGTALLVTRVSEGPDGLRILLRRMTRWRVGIRWYLVPVLALPVGTIGLAVLFGDRASVPSAGTLLAEVFATAVAFLFINLWEETAWAGFMQPHMERRFNFLLATALTALPFALVHVPVRIVTREITSVGELVGQFAVLVLLCLFTRTLFATVQRAAANSVLLAALTHTMFNRSNNVDGVAADVLAGPNHTSGALLVTALLTVGMLIAVRKRLGRDVRRQLDAQEAAALSSSGRR